MATVRDSQGRDARIHGIVLDEGNPGPTLRELLRQWADSGLTPPGDLAERTPVAVRRAMEALTMPTSPRTARLGRARVNVTRRGVAR